MLALGDVVVAEVVNEYDEGRQTATTSQGDHAAPKITTEEVAERFRLSSSGSGDIQRLYAERRLQRRVADGGWRMADDAP
jgi:hypothetical protein